jgi:multicomponent Na+:H+ antiporter subunit C
VNALLAVTVGILYAIGVSLLLQRSLSRIVMGLVILGHGANLLLLYSGGRSGNAPLVTPGAPATSYSDPLPQALALTAIVISFGITAYLLALAWRSWAADGDDKVEDDVEDRRIAHLAGVKRHQRPPDEDPQRHPAPDSDPMRDAP